MLSYLVIPLPPFLYEQLFLLTGNDKVQLYSKLQLLKQKYIY